jgi:DNA repair protein RadC
MSDAPAACLTGTAPLSLESLLDASLAVTAAAVPAKPARTPPRPPRRPPSPALNAQLSLLASAPEHADDALMLTVALMMVTGQETARRLARSLLEAYGSMARAVAASDAELRRRVGLTVPQVAALKAIRAAALRLLASELSSAPILKAWDKLIDYLLAALGNEPVEQLRVLYLDSRNRLIADVVHARGTLNHTPVYPREIMKTALDVHASAIILVHNHPSGDPSPSQADIILTREIAIAARSLGLLLHDHIIIGGNTWQSFRMKGLLSATP